MKGFSQVCRWLPAGALSEMSGLGSDEVSVGVGPTVTEELPRLAHLRDHVEVQVTDEKLLLVRIADIPYELPARVAEIGLPVEVVAAQSARCRPG